MDVGKAGSYDESIFGTSQFSLDARAAELMATLQVGMTTNGQYLEALERRAGAGSSTEPESVSAG